ncbi:hypothetical protein EJ110_NYTH43384 [Nymphaea thermarum]|nr:hypothetical protein EJ110_NYTH43384 [Nymphaea thermarum]
MPVQNLSPLNTNMQVSLNPVMLMPPNQIEVNRALPYSREPDAVSLDLGVGISQAAENSSLHKQNQAQADSMLRQVHGGNAPSSGINCPVQSAGILPFYGNGIMGNRPDHYRVKEEDGQNFNFDVMSSLNNFHRGTGRFMLGSGKYMTWEEDDNMIMAWIMNNVQPQIASTITYYTIVKEMWEFLRQTYSQDKNVGKIFQIEEELHNLRQKNQDLSQYFAFVKATYERLKFLRPPLGLGTGLGKPGFGPGPMVWPGSARPGPILPVKSSSSSSSSSRPPSSSSSSSSPSSSSSTTSSNPHPLHPPSPPPSPPPQTFILLLSPILLILFKPPPPPRHPHPLPLHKPPRHPHPLPLHKPPPPLLVCPNSHSLPSHEPPPPPLLLCPNPHPLPSHEPLLPFFFATTGSLFFPTPNGSSYQVTSIAPQQQRFVIRPTKGFGSTGASSAT